MVLSGILRIACIKLVIIVLTIRLLAGSNRDKVGISIDEQLRFLVVVVCCHPNNAATTAIRYFCKVFTISCYDIYSGVQNGGIFLLQY